MKKQIQVLSIALFSLFTINTFAQVSFGVKGGVVFSNVDAPEFIQDLEQIPQFQTISNTSFGLVSEIEISESFAIQPELNFVTKGFKLDEATNLDLFGTSLPIGVTAISEFNYVDVPLLAKFKVSNDIMSAYVLAGPTIGYATGGKLTTRGKLLVEFDLFETPINLDDIILDGVVISGDQLSTQELGFRAGVTGKFNKRTGFSYGAEFGHRPSLKERGFYTMFKLGFPVFGIPPKDQPQTYRN